MVEKHLKRLLVSEEKVVVPDLGTFLTESVPASLDEAEQVIRPPRKEVVFRDQIGLGENDVLFNSIYEEVKNSAQPEEVSEAIYRFVERLREEMDSSGRAAIEGLGHFVKEDGEWAFRQNDDVFLSAYSYGLSKVPARERALAVIDDEEEDEPPVKPISNSTTKYALIVGVPLLLLAVVLSTLFFVPSVNQMVFGGKPTPKPKPDPVADSTQAQIDSAKAAADSVAVAQKEQEEAEKAKASNELVVSSATGRFYVIVAGGVGLNAAKKRAETLRKQGYDKAKAVQAGGKVRISADDFAEKGQADARKGALAGKFKGCWVFEYK